MRTNKIKNEDVFTYQANQNFKKHIKTQSKQALEIINKSINWNALLYPLEKALSAQRSNQAAGRPSFSIITIVKCFLLQSIYSLSDPRLEEEIADRRSFQIFLDINSGDSIPDETTICRYRTLFAKLGLDKALFESFNNQLRRKNMILEKVTLVDATIKQAQAKPKSKREQDATFTKKRGKTTYGFKGHIGLDYGTEVIHSVDFTPANVHDSDKFDSVILGNESSIYADKGYAQRERKKKLESKGTLYCILEKGYRNHPLNKESIAKNKQLSTIRNIVERPFAFMNKVLSYTRCNYYGLERNRFQFIINATVYNIRRYLTLSCAVA